MLHGVRPSIVYGESWLSKMPGKFSLFDSMCKRWFEDLVKGPAHSVIARPLCGGPLFIVTVFVVRKKLTRRSPKPRPVATILIVLRGRVRIWGSPSSSLAAQPPAKTVNLQLQAFGILLMGDVTPPSRLAPTGIRGVHTNLTVFSLLKVEESILTLGADRLLPVLPWSCHGWTPNSLKLKLFL